MKIAIITRACFLPVLLATISQLRADFSIIENNGHLTTDMPGVTIAPLPAAPGTEAWSVTIDPALYTSTPFPAFLSEPVTEPGKANAFDFLPSGGLGFTWTSDVAAPDPSVSDVTASGTSFSWQAATGDVLVKFEDLGDSSSVPEGGSSWALIASSALGLMGFSYRCRRQTA